MASSADILTFREGSDGNSLVRTLCEPFPPRNATSNNHKFVTPPFPPDMNYSQWVCAPRSGKINSQILASPRCTEQPYLDKGRWEGVQLHMVACRLFARAGDPSRAIAAPAFSSSLRLAQVKLPTNVAWVARRIQRQANVFAGILRGT